MARLALEANAGLPFQALENEIGGEIDYVRHVERNGARRYVSQLLRVQGFANLEAQIFAVMEGQRNLFERSRAAVVWHRALTDDREVAEITETICGLPT